MIFAMVPERARITVLIMGCLVLPTSLSGCSLTTHALTEYEVPTSVLLAFRAAHPHASEIAYQQALRKETKIYRIDFTESGVEQNAEYSVEGKPIIEHPSVPDAKKITREGGDTNVQDTP